MSSRVLWGVPLALAGSGCAFGVRGGPEIRSQAPGAVLEGRGTVTAGIGGASRGRSTQLAIPLSVSLGSRLKDGRKEGTFESGLEYTSGGERFGFRTGLRFGTELGETKGGYVGFRGGPMLLLGKPRDGKASPALTLEGLAAIGLGGDIEEHGLFGACLTIDVDSYSGFTLRMPSGRPFRCDDGETWRGRARLGRKRSPSLGSGLTVAERERIGLEYLEEGLDEHASVPAFERLALELAAHGAPARLIGRARVAALEEVHHARVCFELASQYLGRSVAAPELPHTRLHRARELREVARECLWDGCLGEGRAARALFDRARRTSNARERRALHGIARDENGHARLAANVVVWALGAS